MSTTVEHHELLDRIAALRETVVDQLGADLIQNPQLADALNKQIDELYTSLVEAEQETPPPSDSGLSALVGLGPDAATDLDQTHLPTTVMPYDETVMSERIVAVADLYYIYQHEKIGVFRVVPKLQELFKAGTVKLSSGAGAYGLYQYDRRQVLRYTSRDRMQAYRRVFGYSRVEPPAGAKPNREFQNLFVHFVTQIAQFFRDKRITEVIRPRASDPSYGSVAVVRRAGLDLRHNLKQASYGHINVLRVEMLQLLDEAFRILGTEDVRSLFGADDAWDVIEAINKRYLNRPQSQSAQRNRLAITGREIMRWLAQPHILNATRAEFEALLAQVADETEEWMTTAEVLGIAHLQHRRLSVQPSKNGRSSKNGRPVQAGSREFELFERYG